jgi:hypothetical protein
VGAPRLQDQAAESLNFTRTKRSEAMNSARVNRISSVVMLVLSLTASVVPWSLAWLRGFDQPPLEDEGTSAHLFQLSIAALVPVTLIFFATADWARPWPVIRRVAVPAVLVVLSVTALFYYERVYIPSHF